LRTASPERDGAFVRAVDGEMYVSPWNTRLRVLTGLLEFLNTVPEEVAPAFVSEHDARRAVEELESITDSRDVRVHVLHCNWHVPLRWFTPFADLDRVLFEDASGVGIRYEARVGDAGDRLAHAIAILEHARVDDAITDLARELAAWLAQFAPEGLVELDYGSVAWSFADDDLVDDHSAADLWTCMDALAAGDPTSAATIFAELSGRWGAARAHEAVN
jgi:hypothetical protein